MSQSDEELYRSHLDYRLRPVVKKILTTGFSYISDWNHVKIPAAIHHYISNKVHYETRGFAPNRREFRPPTETWHKGGNCEEQSVLIASLFASVKNIESMLVSVGDGNQNYHLLPLVGFTDSPSRVYSDLETFYKNDRNFSRRFHSNFNWENKDGLVWFIADPEFSHYVGDVTDLSTDGYVNSSGNSWNWENKCYDIML